MTTLRDPQISTEPEALGPLPPTPILVRLAGWLALLVAVVLAVLVWQIVSLRHQVETLTTEVRTGALARDAGAGNVFPPPTTALPADRPPPDAEAARRAITDTYQEVFTPSTDPTRWATLVVDPGDLGARLAALSSGSCSRATVVVTDIRFSGDDRAAVRFRFDGSGVPAGDSSTFTGGATRTPEGWKATSDGISAVLAAAAPFCGGG